MTSSEVVVVVSCSKGDFENGNRQEVEGDEKAPRDTRPMTDYIR